MSKMLGVLLCYNDGDMLDESISHLLENNHDVIVWNHGSTDETGEVLRRRQRDLVEVTDITRAVDFYDIYPLMSKHLMANYARDYDWISWPDQDEILEGASREKPYFQFVLDVLSSQHSWVEFNDFVYWYTSCDSASPSVLSRVRYYSLARHGPPKIRAWRSKATNIRWFNHNRAEGTRYPVLFNLRHYPMRSEVQMRRRITVDRAGIQHGPINSHYEHMKSRLSRLRVSADDLHYDDGGALNGVMKFDWTGIYGTGPKMEPEVQQAFFLSTRGWEIAATARNALESISARASERFGRERLERWIRRLNGKVNECAVITFDSGKATIITPELMHRNEALAVRQPDASGMHAETHFSGLNLDISADASSRSVRVANRSEGAEDLPLLALVPCFGGDLARISDLGNGPVEFSKLRTLYYYLICEVTVNGF